MKRLQKVLVAVHNITDYLNEEKKDYQLCKPESDENHIWHSVKILNEYFNKLQSQK